MTNPAQPAPVAPFEAEEVLGSIDDLLAADEVKYALIPVGDKGKKLRIGSLTAGAMLNWTEANEGDQKKTAGLRMIKDSMVDKDGKRIGTDADIEKLKTLGHKTCEEILEHVLKLNGLKVKGNEAAIEGSAKKD